MSSSDTDGRMDEEVNLMAERVTPHTAVTSAKPGLSLRLSGRCQGDEPWARRHRVNLPPSIGVKLGSVNKVNVI